MITVELLKQRTLDTVLGRYNRKIMNNIHRAEYVECLVAILLGKRWTLPWTEGWDWASWDLRHDTGTTLEIKQSAALQPWSRKENSRTRFPRFDIAPRKGYWKTGNKWVDGPGRAADIYVFAWHPETNEQHADQRDPEQWTFYVVKTKDLPPQQKTINLSGVEKRALKKVQAETLATAVQQMLLA